MRVKINASWYDSADQPILVEVSEMEQSLIGDLDRSVATHGRFAVFPDDCSLSERKRNERWISTRIHHPPPDIIQHWLYSQVGGDMTLKEDIAIMQDDIASELEGDPRLPNKEDDYKVVADTPPDPEVAEQIEKLQSSGAYTVETTVRVPYST